MKTSATIAVLLTATLLCTPAALHAAAFGNALVDASDKGVEVLVSNEIRGGADVNARGDFGVTPLMRAAYNGYTNIMELLINTGADVNAADAGGATALHLAARQGQLEAVKKLIAYDAVLDMADSEGFTPLMRATAARQLPVAELLLKAGADSGVKNEWGDTAFSLAEKRPETASLVALMQRESAAQEQKLTAAQAIRQNISVPVEQVLPKDLPDEAAERRREALAEKPDQGASVQPPQASEDDLAMLEQIKLQQQLKEERQAREQAESLARQAQLARVEREVVARQAAEAKVQAQAALVAEQRKQEETQARQLALQQEQLEHARKQQLAEEVVAKQRAQQEEAARLAALTAQRREREQAELRRQQIAKERAALELALAQERQARQQAEAAARAEQELEDWRQVEIAKATQAPVLPTPKQDIFISEAVPVPLSSGPVVAAAMRENPRPMLLKMSQGVWLQLGPFARENQAVAYYDKLAQTLADFLPSRMKVIATAFLTEAMPRNFLRMGPYTSREVAERACTRFRQGELLCEYVREESDRPLRRNRL